MLMEYIVAPSPEQPLKNNTRKTSWKSPWKRIKWDTFTWEDRKEGTEEHKPDGTNRKQMSKVDPNQT